MRNELHRRDSTGGTVCRENMRGKTEVVWRCMENTGKMKRVRPKRRFMDAVRGQGSGWCDGGGCIR